MLHNLAVILVRARFPENIGMVARSMANMGVSRLILVQPERWGTDEYRQKALSLATGQAGAILAAARQVDTPAEALAPFVAAYGATARTGGIRKEILTPEKAAGQICGLLQRETLFSPADLGKGVRASVEESPAVPACESGSVRGQGLFAGSACTGAAEGEPEEHGRGVAVVFGSEDKGLTNEEAEQCTRLITIPTAEGASSLNLAQAALLVLYECRKAALQRNLPHVGPGKRRRQAERADSRRVTMEEEALLMRALQQTLLSIGYLPEDNPSWFMQPLRRLLRRSGLRRHEFDMLMGVCRKIGHALSR